MKTAILAAAMLGLAACAGHGTHAGMRWQDGSWYASAHDGHGDYYTANPRRPPAAFDVPWAWSVGFVPYGGYCPAAYRYCTSFWADPWYSAAWDPWYYPFAYVPPRHRPRPPPPSITMSNQSPFDQDPFDSSTGRDPSAREPRRGREPGGWGGGRRDGSETPRGRRRGGDGGRD